MIVRFNVSAPQMGSPICSLLFKTAAIRPDIRLIDQFYGSLSYSRRLNNSESLGNYVMFAVRRVPWTPDWMSRRRFVVVVITHYNGVWSGFYRMNRVRGLIVQPYRGNTSISPLL